MDKTQNGGGQIVVRCAAIQQRLANLVKAFGQFHTIEVLQIAGIQRGHHNAKEFRRVFQFDLRQHVPDHGMGVPPQQDAVGM